MTNADINKRVEAIVEAYEEQQDGSSQAVLAMLLREAVASRVMLEAILMRLKDQ